MKRITNSIPNFEADDFVFRFEEQFPLHANTLFADDERLFLGNVVDGRVEDVEEITLIEALQWYAQLTPVTNFSEGSTVLLCTMAAKALSKKDAATGGDLWN